MTPSEQPPAGRRPPLPARLLGIGARAGERVASATGIDGAVETATEEAIVRALESPAVERAIVRVLESDAAQDAFERTLTSPAVERAAARALDSEVVNHAWDRLLASDEVQKLVERIAEAPEVRAAIAAQGVGLISDIGRQIGKVAGRLDDAAERLFRRLIGRPRKRPATSVGLVTRLLGFGIDLVILNAIFLATAAVLTALLGSSDNGISETGVIFGAAAWIVVGSFYLLSFWSLVGQTPGMRFLSIRIEHEGSRVLGRRVARRRLAGAVLAMIPFGLGYLGLLTRDDRRAFHDRHADTVVVRGDRVAAPWSTPSVRE